MSIPRSRRLSGICTRRLPVLALCGLVPVSFLSVIPSASADGTSSGVGTGSSRAAEGSLALPLALNWRYTGVGSKNNPSAPAVTADRVYFATGSRVYAVESATGAYKWRYPEDRALTTGISASPVFSDGTVYVASLDGKLTALVAETGKVRWSFDTRQAINETPAVADGMLYFASSDTLWAVDAKTGVAPTAWKSGVKLPAEIEGAPAYANNTLYVITADQAIHALNATGGKEKWSQPVRGSVLHISPVISNDTVFVASGASLYAFSSRNGAPRNPILFKTDIVVSPSANADGLYTVLQDGTIHALDLRLRERWKTLPKLDDEVIASPTLSGGLLFVGTVQGRLYAVDTETGTIKWMYTVKPSVISETTTVPSTTNLASPIVVANDTLFVLSDDGSLSTFRTDAVDTLAPTITALEPDAGSISNGSAPFRFEARIVDEGSGVNPATVRIEIDGQPVAKRPEGPDNEDKPGFYYDMRTSVLTYETQSSVAAGKDVALPDGRHTVTVSASDYKGNKASKSWTFVIDNTLVKRPRKKPTTTGGPGGPGGDMPGGGRGRGPGGGLGRPGGPGGLGGRGGGG